MLDPVHRPTSAVCIAAACLLAVVVVSPAAFGQGNAEAEVDGKWVRIQRTNEAPVIDGSLDDEVWLRAAVVRDFHQVNPIEFAEPSERTEVYLLYDRNNLYIGARLFDSEPDRINARILRQNQAIGSDDRFFVHIDSFNNRRSGYLFGVNPNSVRYDGIYENLTNRSFDWDGIWQAAAAIDDQGWTVEIAIPFKTLSFDPSNTTWRMNFARNIERKNESMAWVSRNRNTDLSTMGEVRGISQIDQGVGLDVVPSISIRDRKDFATAETETDTQPSLDVFYNITPSLNGSLTVNTDFSATEVDNRQVNLTRFSLFFPERRDFFLQDVDIFQFGRLDQDGRPFFSRTIGISASGEEVPIDYGAKISGRVGRFDIGTLAVRQAAYDTIDPTTALVARVAANVLQESSVGVIVTDGDPQTNLDNSVVGVDFRYSNTRLPGGRSAEGEAWYQETETEGVSGDSSAWGLGMRFPSSSGLRGGVGISQYQKNYYPGLGFVRRRGVQQYNFFLNDIFRPSNSPIRTISSGINVDRIEYLDNGDIQSQSINLSVVNIDLNSQDSFNLDYSRDKEGLRDPFEISPGITISPGLYTFDNLNIGVRTGNQRKFGMGLFLNDGGFYDGDRFSVGGFLGWRPSRHFRTNVNYQYNDITLPEGAFTTRLFRVQLEIVFSSKLSWINLIQYDDVSEVMGINSRLHWIPQAGREAYLVLNHNLEDYDRDNTFHSAFSELTLKYSYTFRF